MSPPPEDAPISNGGCFRLSFWWGAAVELGLLLLAVFCAWLLSVPVWAQWHWKEVDLLWGIIAVAPMLLVLGWMIRSTAPALQRIRAFLHHFLRPALQEWQMPHLLVISSLAGVAEEMLFRGLVQGWLSESLGAWPALLLASALFGICHWITPAYALFAGVMGGYLGILWIWTGNLLVPIVAHALYDFLALIWLLRFQSHGGPTADAARYYEIGPDNHDPPAPTDPP